jgi:hypothetical protein
MKTLVLGEVVMTRGVFYWAAKNKQGIPLITCLTRHHEGDWGDVCAEDKAANDYSVEHGERVLSSYMLLDTKIWIITEWDRSYTTILFPDEY